MYSTTLSFCALALIAATASAAALPTGTQKPGCTKFKKLNFKAIVPVVQKKLVLKAVKKQIADLDCADATPLKNLEKQVKKLAGKKGKKFHVKALKKDLDKKVEDIPSLRKLNKLVETSEGKPAKKKTGAWVATIRQKTQEEVKAAEDAAKKQNSGRGIMDGLLDNKDSDFVKNAPKVAAPAATVAPAAAHH